MVPVIRIRAREIFECSANDLRILLQILGLSIRLTNQRVLYYPHNPCGRVDFELELL